MGPLTRHLAPHHEPVLIPASFEGEPADWTCLPPGLCGEFSGLGLQFLRTRGKLADTQFEPRAVYDHLARLERAAHAARVPVHRVTAGSLRDDALDPTRHHANLPLFVANPDGTRGMVRRQCTRSYKVAPLRRKIRELWIAAGRPTTPVEQWLGISRDEAHRVRSSDVAYIQLQYPLIEQGLTRADCQQWLQTHGWPSVPTSACVACPFHSDQRWRQLRDRSPDEWAEAVAFDRAIRGGHPRLGGPPLRGEAFVHRSVVPLDRVDLSGPADREVIDGFGNECEGMCAT